MKRKVKISKSGLISIIALVLGFYVALNSLASLNNIITYLFSGWTAILSKIILPLLILTICFVHIGRMNKPRKTQIIYIILAIISVILYLCNFYEQLLLITYGYFVWDYYIYIPAIITIIGIIIEFVLLGTAEKIRGKELCME